MFCKENPSDYGRRWEKPVAVLLSLPTKSAHSPIALSNPREKSK